MKNKKKKKKESVIEDFKKFINRGNIIDMATGIIIGTAFTAIVTSLVNDIIMPLISRAINFDLTEARWILREGVSEIVDGEEQIIISEISLNYGSFIQFIINFLIIAIALFVIVKCIRRIRNGYIKSQIKYVKKLKEKHPEFFDEEDEFGTLLYEKLKNEHPEEFQDDINKEIEEQKAQAETVKSPVELNNELLKELNTNLEKIYELNKKEEETQN